MKMISGFECESWWSNVAPGDPGWWWVYLIGERETPIYVGMSGPRLSHRLAEHRRFVPPGDRSATVIAVNGEAAARRLERELVLVLEPDGNETFRHASWAEQQWYGDLHSAWDEGEVDVCPNCHVLRRRMSSRDGGAWWWEIASVGDDDCESHTQRGLSDERFLRSFMPAPPLSVRLGLGPILDGVFCAYLQVPV